MNFEELWHSLTVHYDTGEARAVARWLLEVGFGLSMTDVVCGGVEQLSDDALRQLRQMQQRLLQGEPVQYVVGQADFGPRQFSVSPHVLIPRPETYELCQWVTESCREASNASAETGLHILDIGTGSGCIACTLAADLPKAQVTGWDISEGALTVARENAKRTNVLVSFKQVDALSLKAETACWQVIVSNPPYICQREAADIAPHVLEHEPHEALFVPDDNPLLFYRAIAHYASHALSRGGMLFFELNPLYAEDCRLMLTEAGFIDIALRSDQFGKLRFMKAIKEDHVQS